MSNPLTDTDTVSTRSTPKPGLGAQLFGWAVGILVVFLLILWDGWLGVTLWGWFAVPYLHAPRLTLLQFIGVGLSFAMVFPRAMPPTLKESEKWEKYFQHLIIAPLILWFFGWILHFHFGV